MGNSMLAISYLRDSKPGRFTFDATLELAKAVKRVNDHKHFTRQVVLFVTHDVSNDFNSARWYDMLEALKRQLEYLC